MKFAEWVMVIGGLIVGGATVVLVALLALMPYAVIALAGFALLRYLGWL